MNQKPLQINSEIGVLKTVLLHRPGEELENLTPDYLKDLLFDDIPHLKVAQQEHDEFANVLRDHGVEVLYLDELVTEALNSDNLKAEFVDEMRHAKLARFPALDANQRYGAQNYGWCAQRRDFFAARASPAAARYGRARPLSILPRSNAEFVLHARSSCYDWQWLDDQQDALASPPPRVAVHALYHRSSSAICWPRYSSLV